jgi:hypothetical protein
MTRRPFPHFGAAERSPGAAERLRFAGLSCILPVMSDRPPILLDLSRSIDSFWLVVARLPRE